MSTYCNKWRRALLDIADKRQEFLKNFELRKQPLNPPDILPADAVLLEDFETTITSWTT